MRQVLLLLPFLLDGLLTDVMLDYKRELSQVSSLGLQWFLMNGTMWIADGIHQTTRWISRSLAPWVKSTWRLCTFDFFQHISHILHLWYLTYFVHVRYLDQYQIVFPYTNKLDNPIMATGKNHIIVHTPGDVTLYCDAINISCDSSEEAHKTWVKEQDLCTNQGPQVQLSMMLHSLHNRACSTVVIALRFGTQGPGFEPCFFLKACYMPHHGSWMKLRVFVTLLAQGSKFFAVRSCSRY